MISVGVVLETRVLAFSRSTFIELESEKLEFHISCMPALKLDSQRLDFVAKLESHKLKMLVYKIISKTCLLMKMFHKSCYIANFLSI